MQDVSPVDVASYGEQITQSAAKPLRAFLTYTRKKSSTQHSLGAPDNATYWFHYAGALRKLGKHEEALGAAQTAVRLASKELVWYRGRLADILARCGRLEEAEACHRELLEQRPDSPTFWLWYAQFLVEKRPERRTDARGALQKCESLNHPPIVPRKVLDELRAQCLSNTGLGHEP